MNTQSSVQSWAIASRLFLASRSPNTSWRLRLMRVSTVSGTALSQEVNTQTVDLGSELRIGVQTSLETAPMLGARCPKGFSNLLGEKSRLLEWGKIPAFVELFQIKRVRP